MKYTSTFNAMFSFAAMLIAVYRQDLGLAGAWCSAVVGWLIVSAHSWVPKE